MLRHQMYGALNLYEELAEDFQTDAQAGADKGAQPMVQIALDKESY